MMFEDLKLPLFEGTEGSIKAENLLFVLRRFWIVCIAQMTRCHWPVLYGMEELKSGEEVNVMMGWKTYEMND